MRTKFSRDIFIVSRYFSFITTLIFIALFQVGLCSLWAEEKIGSGLSLSEAIELALDFNTQKHKENSFLPSEDVVFFVKKYYYQIQTQAEQLSTAEEVRDHFQDAVDKSVKIFEEGEGDILQSDITKLKLGLSDTLNDIISLKHAMQITNLHLGELIGKEIKSDTDIAKTDIIPLPFLYSNFDIYLETKSLSPSSSKTSTKISVELDAGDRLTLHKAFINVKEADAKVVLGKKNRKITRALLVAEVANYDFGIGDPQELFEALIIYTRVLSGYLDSIYALNVAVAELEKATAAIYK